jgi:signal recognition particle receptor subunit alpha
VFVVAYQKILQLSYVDKFLNDVHLEFRDKYKNDLSDGRYFQEFDFVDSFNATLQSAEQWAKAQAKAPKPMRTFDQSNKSKKTVASMIERKGEEKKPNKKKEVNFIEEPKVEPPSSPKANNVFEEDIIAANRAKFAQKMNKKKSETKYVER